MTLYETMSARRSVRKYDITPLDTSTLTDIKSFLGSIKQLDGQKARFHIVTGDQVGQKFAPHYITAYCDESTAAYINVGYVLEKVDLYLQSMGLGSLWLGLAKPKEKKQDFCIMLAFGRTSVPVRSRVEEFDRLPLAEISNSDSDVAKAARLAPSAVNSQPWKLYFTDNSVAIRWFGRGMMKVILRKRLNNIDLGICTRFVVEALREEGRQVKTITLNTDSKEPRIEVTFK